MIDEILYNFSYPVLFVLSFMYFLVLYFGLAPLFLFVCRYLEQKNLLQKIIDRKPSTEQLRYEIKHSFKSIVVFGFSILPVIFAIRNGYVHLIPDSFLNVLTGVLILSIWNEVHFYLVHKMMHGRLLMKKIHYVHHRSIVPSVYAVYSFHWVEALLLSTVPITIIPFIPISVVAIFIYPLASILLNYAGHCNYRFGDGNGSGLWTFGTRHNQHHSIGRKSFGFGLDFMDRLFTTKKRRR